MQLLLIDILKFQCRQDFEVGGFVSDIVGRLVNLHPDKNAMEAKDVTVQVEYAEVSQRRHAGQHLILTIMRTFLVLTITRTFLVLTITTPWWSGPHLLTQVYRR